MTSSEVKTISCSSTDSVSLMTDLGSLIRNVYLFGFFTFTVIPLLKRRKKRDVKKVNKNIPNYTIQNSFQWHAVHGCGVVFDMALLLIPQTKLAR